jgi:hypothetical protein
MNSHVGQISTQRDDTVLLVMRTKQYLSGGDGSSSSSVVSVLQIREMYGETYTRKGVSLTRDEIQVLNDVAGKDQAPAGHLYTGRRSVRVKRIDGVGVNIWVRSSGGRESHLFVADADIGPLMQLIPQAVAQMDNVVEDMDIN